MMGSRYGHQFSIEKWARFDAVPCLECGALVHVDTTEIHDAWHDRATTPPTPLNGDA